MTDEARYILAKKIARGGMAEIYLGKQIGEDGFQRLCAIKRILPHYAADQEFVQMFRDEAHICKRLQHANIVRVEGFEEVDGSYAIIMEFVDGADLRTLLHAVEQAKKKMPTPMACFIVAEAARGLHYAHTKVDEITQQALGIVHRDISPQNILVSYEGEVKVTDFGIADAESKLTETRPGIVKGKYSYMSPEQISAKPVDCRTDVFALSIVLWEMLAMRRLFQGENEVDTIQRVKNCRIDIELRSLNAEVDEELDGILKKGLAKDSKKRYRTAADFEKDLRRYMSRKHPDFTPEDLGNFLKKNMESRRSESAADIKKTLTETNLRPGRKGAPGAPKKPGVDIAFEAPATGPAIGLAKAASQGGPGRPPASQVPRTSTSFNKPQYTRNTNHAVGVIARRNGGVNKTMLFVAVAVIALAIGLKVIMNMTAQPKPAQLLLRTLPTRVKIAVDNKVLNKGRYVDPSASPPLRLGPGKHTLTVRREGYESAEYTLNLEEGERATKDDIVLVKDRKLQVATVRVRAKAADKPYKVDVNDGYYIIKVLAGHESVFEPDLFREKTYRMRVQPEGGKGFVCKFTPRTATLHEIVIDLKVRNCAMSGS